MHEMNQALYGLVQSSEIALYSDAEHAIVCVDRVADIKCIAVVVINTQRIGRVAGCV